MPRITWLLAAAAVLLLVVPPSAVSYPPGLEGVGQTGADRRLALNVHHEQDVIAVALAHVALWTRSRGHA